MSMDMMGMGMAWAYGGVGRGQEGEGLSQRLTHAAMVTLGTSRFW